MQNVQNAQKRTEMLENELLKIDNELFELEKKYGEFNIKKGGIKIMQKTESPKIEPENTHPEEIKEEEL
jgi:hypothetical protein